MTNTRPPKNWIKSLNGAGFDIYTTGIAMHLLVQYLYGDLDSRGYLTIGKMNLSKEAGVNPKTLVKCLDTLERYGFISLHKDGFGSTTFIQLLNINDL